MLVVIEGLCQGHVLVHEDDCENLPRPVCLIPISFVEVQAGMETHLACMTEPSENGVMLEAVASVHSTGLLA